ncbi:MAG: cache domain-containing protein [Terriglobales bacterium]
MSLKSRFRIFIALAMLGPIIFAGLWLSQERSRILREKQEKAKNLVEVAYSLLAESYQLEQAGMPRADAQKRAILLLKDVRYEGDNYFWINDLHPTMVMHPTKPQMDGADLSSFKDPTGKAFFIEMADTVRQNGAGFVAYEWPRPGTDKPVPKISYIKGFAPWGWIVGTGIYIDDVNAIWRQDAVQAATALLVLLAVLAVVGLGACRRMFGPLNRMVACMKDVAQGEGDLTRRLEVPPDREVAELAGWFNTFIDRLRGILLSVAAKRSPSGGRGRRTVGQLPATGAGSGAAEISDPAGRHRNPADGGRGPAGDRRRQGHRRSYPEVGRSGPPRRQSGGRNADPDAGHRHIRHRGCQEN